MRPSDEMLGDSERGERVLTQLDEELVVSQLDEKFNAVDGSTQRSGCAYAACRLRQPAVPRSCWVVTKWAMLVLMVTFWYLRMWFALRHAVHVHMAGWTPSANTA